MSVIRLTWACVTVGFLLAMLAAAAAVFGIARHELGDAHPLLGRLAWASALAVGAAGALVVLALHRVQRWATRPLQGFEEQVRALAERRFVSIAQPNVSEWVDLSRALNVLVARVSLMLEEKESRLDALKSKMAHDALTGVASRSQFVERLGTTLAATDEAAVASTGIVAIVRLHDLVGMNQRAGRERTDDFLRAAATAMSTRLYPLESRGALLARLNGADFCVLLPSIGEAEAKPWLEGLGNALAALHDDRIADSWHVAWIGATRWRPGETVGDVLTRADAMVMAAETRRERWCLTSPAEPLHLITVAQWRMLIESALEAGRLQLAYFEVRGTDGKTLHREGMLRMKGPDGAVLPAQAFIPPAIRTGRVIDLDVRAIELALAELAGSSDEIAVNISPHSLRRPIFLRRVRELLSRRAGVAARLWIEVDEVGLDGASDDLRRFAEMLEPFGCKLGIEHFGQQMAAFVRLRSTRLHYLKLDRSFCIDVHASVSQQAYTRVVVDVARGAGAMVIGEGVNDPRDAQMLESLGCIGWTGPWVGATTLATATA